MANDAAYDIFIIGGGINGCGIARDAVGRGYAVGLAEMSDLGSGTSSGSTKLVHGGLRYLEHYEFRLVREALLEREVLWRSAPHIIWPLRFILPHHNGLRPSWLLRLGLFIYDHLGGRKLLPPTRVLDMRQDEAGRPLKPVFSKAFEYSDCWVNDTRLVVLNAVDAAERGATIMPRTKVVSAVREGDIWKIALDSSEPGESQTVSARLLVNAAGPWVDHVLASTVGRNDVHNVRLVKGSHIVVKRLFDHDRCYIFQNADGRIIFAIPYEDDFTLIGTTDQDYEADPAAVEISQSEIDYLCAAASEYFEAPITPDQVVWTYSGVRPLFDDGASKAQEATRDYVLKDEGGDGVAPLINIFGGKITTYRRLAESTLALIGNHLGRSGSPWTATAPLPGGEFAPMAFADECDQLLRDYAFLTAQQARRLMRLYGARARIILGDARAEADLGRHFGGGLYEAEVRYLIETEFVQEADDILWRRTKDGLHLSENEIDALKQFMSNQSHGTDTAAAE